MGERDNMWSVRSPDLFSWPESPLEIVMLGGHRSQRLAYKPTQTQVHFQIRFKTSYLKLHEQRNIIRIEHILTGTVKIFPCQNIHIYWKSTSRCQKEEMNVTDQTQTRYLISTPNPTNWILCLKSKISICRYLHSNYDGKGTRRIYWYEKIQKYFHYGTKQKILLIQW